MKKLFICVTALLLMLGAGHPAAAMEANVFEDVQIHGFISQGYLHSDEYNYLAHNSTDGSFEYNEMGINFSKNMTDRLRVGMQFFARDIGDAGNDKITIDWAYGDYRVQDWLGIRAGRIKLPYALYNETRDVDLLRTSIVLPQGLYNDTIRDTLIAFNGAGIYGNVDLSSVGALDYQFIMGSMTLDNESGVKKYVDSSLAAFGGELSGELDNDTGYCGALRWDTPIEGLRLAYAYNEVTTISDNDFGAFGMAENKTVSTSNTCAAEYTWDSLVLAFEYQNLEFDQNFSGVVFLPEHMTRTVINYYFSASYRFNDLFSLGAFYSIYYPDKDDKDGDGQVAMGNPDHRAWEKDLALSLRFDLNDFWVFKVEGHKVNGTANVLDIDNADSDFSEEDWYYYAAKMTFSF